MLTKSQVRAILDKMEVLQDGHFLHKNGRHGAQGVFPMRVLQAPEYAVSLATTLASVYRTQRPQVVLVGPGPSALLGMALAKALHARVVYAVNDGARWDVSPGQALVAGERVVICEDVVTEPAELRGRVELVRASGAELAGVMALFDLTGDAALPWPLEALVKPELTLRHPIDCPQCAAGIPLSAPRSLVVV